MLKPYDEYKSINIPWINEIPKHWSLLRNKNVLLEKKDTVGDNSNNYKLLSLTLRGVIARDMESGKGKFPKDFDTYKIVNKSNIIFCLFDIDETPRTVGISQLDGMITGAYDIFKIQNINGNYLYYYYLSIDTLKAMKPMYTGLRKVIGVPRFLGIKLPIPSHTEQDQIARYLDWQLSKINKLINAKKKQIELLKEQKQAVINKAVTKGLNPNAKMKDSGIAWFGEIPEHWHTRPFSKVATVKSNLVHPNDYLEYLQVSPANIEKNTGVLLPCTTVAQTGIISDNHFFYEGQILYSKIRPRLNKVTIAPFEGLCSADMYPIETVLETKYLMYFMLSTTFLSQISMSGNRVKMPKINKEELSGVMISFPTKKEQIAIVQYLNNMLDHLNNITKALSKAIEKIEEYKTSLISEVVTGQVDVRNVTVPEFEAEEVVDDLEDLSEIEELADE